MRKAPFIWLGSGRASRRHVSRKGMLLEQAARSGLPVPSGGILLDDFYQICLTEGIVELVGDAIIIPDPIWLHEVLFRDMRFPRLEGRAAVRTAAEINVSDGLRISGAQLGVDLSEPEQLAGALKRLWSILSHSTEGLSHDILIMKMVTTRVAGEASTDTAYAKDQVRVMVDGDPGKAEVFELEKLSTFQRATAGVPAHMQRLQKLLRGLRRSLGKGQWRLDWADDGEICWLLQID